MHRSRVRFVSVAILFAVAAMQMWAQATSTGTVSGQVTDPQGAVVAAAEVRLVDAQTNTSRSTTTNDVGRYTFVNVEPGAYDVSVTKEGFSQAKVAGQKVE